MSHNSSQPPNAAIEQKIDLARDLFRVWGEALLDAPDIRRRLQDIEERISSSNGAMRDFGIVEACRRCDEEEGGSCCGAGIENKYSPVLLLMNLLLGVDLPDGRRWENSCRFLGEKGCSLRIRHVLCVNYLCLKIQKDLGPKSLSELQAVTGHEMDAVFLAHEAIKKFMNR